MKALHVVSALLALSTTDAYETKKRKPNKPLPKKSKEQIAIEHGQKSFLINGVEVIALNKKNAIKKYNKMAK